MRKVYLLPNLITAFGLACGLFVIFKVNMIEPGSGDYEVMLSSALLLLVAAFADFADGAVARVLHGESEFGVLFDSLADVVSFGVAPSVLMLKSLSLQQGTFLSFCSATGAMVFSLCAVLRLVRFSVQATSKKNASEKSKHFTGLPIDAAAGAAVSINLLLLAPYTESYFTPSYLFRAIVLSVSMILLGYLMVCRLKFPSLKVLHFRIPSFYLVFFTVVLSIVVLYGLFHYFAVVFFCLSWGYILLALILSCIRKIMGKGSKTLKDFDPDQDFFEKDK
jgi:CDP-diacylglycerol--serine O-phosphatidyltransferase